MYSLPARGLSLWSMWPSWWCASSSLAAGGSWSEVMLKCAPSRVPPWSMSAVLAAAGFSNWMVATCFSESCSTLEILPQKLPSENELLGYKGDMNVNSRKEVGEVLLSGSLGDVGDLEDSASPYSSDDLSLR